MFSSPCASCTISIFNALTKRWGLISFYKRSFQNYFVCMFTWNCVVPQPYVPLKLTLSPGHFWRLYLEICNVNRRKPAIYIVCNLMHILRYNFILGHMQSYAYNKVHLHLRPYAIFENNTTFKTSLRVFYAKNWLSVYNNSTYINKEICRTYVYRYNNM